MSHSQLDYIKHIYDEVLFVEQVMQGKTFLDIEDDLLLQKAILRCLEVIGEAAKRISNDFKTKYPDVNWKAMAGTRDKLIHDYFEVDIELVFDITQSHIPSLRRQLEGILKNES
jgi:uncharacterized protein with HEPN domain